MNHLLIDGHNLAWRVYHQAASTDKNFDSRTPETANEIFYGCLNVLAPLVNPTKNILGRHNIILALDQGNNWRQAINPEYKEGRGSHHSPTSRFGAQMIRLPAQMAALGIRTLSVPGMEADDIISLLTRRPDIKADTKVLMSNDKDIIPFVADDVYYFNASSKTLVTPKNFGAYSQELFKLPAPLTPNNWPVFRAIVGDQADKLIGVPGFQAAYGLQVIQALEKSGAKFGGYAQAPAELMSTVRQHVGSLPKPLAHFNTPANLKALEDTFTLVQITQAPQDLQARVMTADLTPLPPPSYAQVKDILAHYHFEQFIKYGEKWAAGFTVEGLPKPKAQSLELGL